MKTFHSTLLLVSSLLFINCAGIERVNAKHKSDSQLKLRHSQVERELAGLRFTRSAGALVANHSRIAGAGAYSPSDDLE